MSDPGTIGQRANVTDIPRQAQTEPAPRQSRPFFGKIFHTLQLDSLYVTLKDAAAVQQNGGTPIPRRGQAAAQTNRAATSSLQQTAEASTKEKRRSISSQDSSSTASTLFAEAFSSTQSAVRRDSTESTPIVLEDIQSSTTQDLLKQIEGKQKEIAGAGILNRGKIKALKRELEELKTAHKTSQVADGALKTVATKAYALAEHHIGQTLDPEEKKQLRAKCISAAEELKKGQLVEIQIGTKSYYLSENEAPKEYQPIGKGADAEVFVSGGRVYKKTVDTDQARISYANERAAIQLLMSDQDTPGMEYIARYHGVSEISGSEGSRGAIIMEHVGGGDMEKRTLVLELAKEVLGLSEDKIAKAQKNKNIFQDKESEIQKFIERRTDADHPAIPKEKLYEMFFGFKPLDRQGRIELGAQVLQGAAAITAKGIFHNDLSVNNILDGGTGIKIMDFGKAQNRETLLEQAQASSHFLCKSPAVANSLYGFVNNLKSHISASEGSKGKESVFSDDAFLDVLCNIGIFSKHDDGRHVLSCNAKVLKDLDKILVELSKNNGAKNLDESQKKLLQKALDSGLIVEGKKGALQLNPKITTANLDHIIGAFTFLKKPITIVPTQEYISRQDQALVELYAEAGMPSQYIEMVEKQQVMMTGIAVYKLLTGDFPTEEMRKTAEGRQGLYSKLEKIVGSDSDFAQLIMDMISEISVSVEDASSIAALLKFDVSDFDNDAHAAIGIGKFDGSRPGFAEVQSRLIKLGG